MKKSFRLGKIIGIPIEINYTWFIIFGLITWTLATGYFPYILPRYSVITYWIMAVIAAILLFVSLLLHELSHSFVAIKSKLPIKGITLFIFGGVAHMEKEPSDPKTEFRMAIAGPLCSFALAAIFWIITNLLSNLNIAPPVVAITKYLFILNGIVAVFNLIPGFPLDGGRILRAGLWSYLKDIKRATRIARNFGKVFAYLLMFIGLFEIFRFGALISGFWLIFIGFFLLEAAEMSYQQVVMKTTLTGIHVKDIMSKNVITVAADITLHDLVEQYFFKFRFHSFPVISDDTLLGLVTLHDVKEIPREKWVTEKAKEAMIPVEESLIISQGAEVTEALSKMAKSGIGRLLVIEDSKLIGILSQRDIMSLFEFKNHFRSLPVFLYVVKTSDRKKPVEDIFRL